jgi:hypothetical protein
MEQANARELDYLTPFIRNVADPTMLTMAEAMEVRQACLDALKVCQPSPLLRFVHFGKWLNRIAIRDRAACWSAQTSSRVG